MPNKIKTIVFENFMESLKAVLPIVLVIIVLCFTIAPIPNSTFLSFLVGATLLVAGMSFFELGVQTAMIPIGERIGAYITKKRKLWLIVLVTLLVGILVTVAEPDLQVLANQVPTVPNMILVMSVAVGVGILLVVAILRMLIYIPIAPVLIGCYILVFALSFFVPREYLAIAFDSGGVTTGPMTVPFILALGIGVASIRSDKHSGSDSFGLVGLSSVGPILAVMILGLIYGSNNAQYVSPIFSQTENSREIWQQFTDNSNGFLLYIKEVLLALAPVVVFFLVFQMLAFRMKKSSLIKILIGIWYTFLGLVLFLTGVNVGFLPAGLYLGGVLAGLSFNWIIIPIGMIIGYFIVSAEPAVHVLNKQVEEISSGAIPAKAMMAGLSIGMSASLGLSMVRLLYNVPLLWFLIPGYAIALTLAFFVPKIFTAIAFDSGGVASGPMTATFLLPFAIGVCQQLQGNVIIEAFGVVAMVAMTPLITIQIMGFIYNSQLKHAFRESEKAENIEIID